MSEFQDLFGEWGNAEDGTPKPLSVEPYLGTGSMGPKYGPSVNLPGLPQSTKRRLVRTALGNEAVSEATVYAPLEHAASFPLHSRVTLASGRVAAILVVSSPDVYGVMGFVVVNCE